MKEKLGVHKFCQECESYFLFCFSDLSEIFGGLTGGILLALICIFCYGYSRLTEEQRQRLGRLAALGFRVIEFLVRLWRALTRRRQDEGKCFASFIHENIYAMA